MGLNLDAVSSSLYNQSAASQTNAAADKLKDTAESISSNSTEQEIRDAVKEFETYLLEQVVKQVKKSVEAINKDEKDGPTSTMVDFYMDSTIEELSDQLLEEIGGDITDQFVDQMMRMYNI